MFVTGRDSEPGNPSESTEMTQWHYSGLATVGESGWIQGCDFIILQVLK